MIQNVRDERRVANEKAMRVFQRLERLSHLEYNGEKWKVTLTDASSWVDMELTLSLSPREVITLRGQKVIDRFLVKDETLHFYRRNLTLGAVEEIKCREWFREAADDASNNRGDCKS